MKHIGQSCLQVFSVSIQLNEPQSASVIHSCSVGEDGTIQMNSESPSLDFNTEKEVKLYGTVDARLGPCVTVFYYKQEQDNPESIDPENDTLSLSGPTSFCPTSGDLEMRFHLRDAHRDLEISRGWLENTYIHPNCYHDKRLSTIVRGKHGWATIHYTLFSKAVEARMTMELIVNGECGSSSCVVFGSLFVRYGGHDYRYEYQRKYFRNVLFKKPRHDGELLCGNSLVLPLSFPLLAVPMTTPLIVEADLHVTCGEIEIANVKTDDAEIPQPSELDSRSSKIVVGDNARLHVMVSWS